MRIILVIILILSQNISSGQWLEQNSGTSNNLNKVKFISTNTGYIVGDTGTMLKTEDGGNTWKSLSVGSQENLTSVWFLDEEMGFIGGEMGLISKTEDGGVTWEQLDLEITSQVEIYFVNNLIGFIGTANLIYRSMDSGNSWNEAELIDVIDFNRIYEIEFVTNTTGYALNARGILKSIDGGLSWTQIIDDSHPDYNGANILTSCEIISEEVAFFGSPYYIGLYETLDGLENMSFRDMHISDIEFPTSEIGFAIDSISPINIIKTIDGGDTWISIFTENNLNAFSDIDFIDETHGWIIGKKGTIFHTDNGGILTSLHDYSDTDASRVLVYPIPAFCELNIESHIDIHEKIKSIELYDIYGAKMYSEDVIDNKSKIILTKKLTSICILVVVFETGEIVTKKLLLE